MSIKTSDKNVANIEKLNKFLELYKQIKEYASIVANVDKDFFFESVDLLLAEREQMLKEREKYTIRLTDEEYRKVIENAQRDTSNDTVIAHKFAVMQQQIEQKDKRIQELERKNKHLTNTSDYETVSLECTHLEEQLDIANSRIQDLEEEKNKTQIISPYFVKENYIPKQVIKDILQDNRNELFSMTYLSKEQYRPYEMQIERINKIEQELLGGEK